MLTHGQALRIDAHSVTRWIKSGHLKAKPRGSARTPQQNGDGYRIQENGVRRGPNRKVLWSPDCRCTDINGNPLPAELRYSKIMKFLESIGP
jgi:hypothetical protein